MRETARANPKAARTGNNLLAALTPDDFQLLTPFLEEKKLETGFTLFEPGDIIENAWFPCDEALVSYRVSFADGRLVEVALVGREGAVGGIVSNGRLPAFSRAIAQNGGRFLRVGLRDLDTLKGRAPGLRNMFSRYADCLMAQVYQATACNAAHSVEARCAKWMLATIDRTGSKTLVLTHEDLAVLLGVGRSYASRILLGMKSDGVVQLSRGRITVDDCESLEAIACDCDSLVRAHFLDRHRGGA
jgi:CRP-like cAMP-binding protein